ncbi:MAG: glycosyltransferase family 39 protein [Chromatiales bacterium]|nr:glycosyltransferase family 39 protein [Chromatiales bacterium]
MELLDRGKYEYDLQQPPLARLLIAAGPYLAGARSRGTPPPDGGPEGVRILYDTGHYDQFLTLARAGALPFVALLVWATWLWGRRVLPPAGAALATALLATTPVVLGHGALATLDVPAAATCLLGLYALQSWIERGSFRNAVAFGVAAGLAVCTKLSAIPFLGVGLVMLSATGFVTERLAGRHPSLVPPPSRWTGLLVAALLVLVCITFTYGGRFTDWTDDSHRYNQALAYLFGTSGRLHDLAYDAAAGVPLPDGLRLFIGGIQAVSVHNAVGHASYLLGEVHTDGRWYFYLVALAVKTPLPLLLLGVPGLATLGLSGWRRHDSWQMAPLVLFAALLAFCSVFSRINIGVRHVLVLYPLLALGAAEAIVGMAEAVRRLGPATARSLCGTALAAVVLWQLASPILAWPDYLAYFNEAVREPRDILIDSDLDWGQDLRRLERRLASLDVPSVSLAYRGTADLYREALPPWRPLKPGERATGWIAVTALARAAAPGGYAWLDAYLPRERIGRSIDLYFIPPE